MGFQQLGRPVGYLPYHLHGPPWLAGLGLRRWYTYLVYPQHSSPHICKVQISQDSTYVRVDTGGGIRVIDS
jgi:hypothetical protein